jgi:two-component system phosphate regulon sensor histidine kinase PhoR
MQRKKNILTLILMSSSIGLLILLQVFWLKNSYEKAYYDFRRESGMLFKTTVLALRDSLFLANVEQLPADSVEKVFTARTRIATPGQQIVEAKIDTVKRYVGIQEETSRIQIIVSDSADIVQENFVGPLSTKIQNIQYSREPGMKKSFIIRMGPDTLDLDTLSALYGKALASQNINASFEIKHKLSHERLKRHLPGLPDEDDRDNQHFGRANIFSDTMHCESIPINPFHRYQASLTGVRGLIFHEISPQILFGLFLTLVTCVSFIFMYRNIRTQQRLMESKNEFISNVTHELKTPVATVSVALEALKNFSAMQNPQLTQEYLDIALRELNRLSTMTDKILNTSIYESRGVEFEPEEVDLNRTIEQMLTSMKLVFEKRAATVDYKRSGEDFKLSGSTLHLTNVLYNLVDNALKYSGENPKIEIGLHNDGKTIQLTVKDNGVGIASAYQRKIFEKFFRVPSGDVHNIKGYGLGLSYVASVVKSHHGVIDVKSQPEKGSTFTITLPRIGKIFRFAIPAPSLKPSAE